MILDILENSGRYSGMNSSFKKAFDFLLRPDLKNLPTGKYEIDQASVFAMVSMDPGRKKEEAQLEIHRKYIDIQLVLAGTDTMGWKPLALCEPPATEYDPETDLRFFADTPDAWVTVKSGAFAIFYPEDAHMPLISSGRIHKVVVKIQKSTSGDNYGPT
jgi:YhcH/YjgK/YiaL family protein